MQERKEHVDPSCSKHRLQECAAESQVQVRHKCLLVYDSIFYSNCKVSLKDSFTLNLHAISQFLTVSPSFYHFFVSPLPGNKLCYYFILPTLNVLFAACRFTPAAVLEVLDQQIPLISDLQPWVRLDTTKDQKTPGPFEGFSCTGLRELTKIDEDVILLQHT